MPLLEKDAEIRLPQVTVLKASAGSGKTHCLTERFVQFLLSRSIPQNHLSNILAITFSNNAAKEMKERILSWLKDLYFGDSERIEALSEIVSLSREHLSAKAGALVDQILSDYTEFQVKTIDSFMTSLYKASAIDLGYSPDFEIIMAPEERMAYAFHRFLRRVSEKSPEAKFLEKLLETLLETRGGESAYPWDPSKDFLEEMVELYQKLSGIVGEAKIVEAEEEIESIKREIRETAEHLDRLVEKSKLPKSKGSSFYRILETVRKNRFPDLMDKGLVSPPVTKPNKSKDPSSYPEILRAWAELGDRIRRYITLYSQTYFTSYLKTYEAFNEILEEVKRREATVFIHDINKKLSKYLTEEIVPDVYFRLGETIYHYLIDEFQDTSPLQWSNLLPLIENSLSQGGSLFTVGDTKQAIYGFRNADYEIMRGLESKNPFPSAHHSVRALEINYRSREAVVNFTKAFFEKAVATHEKYEGPARRSGLLDYQQKVKEEQKGSGYVEVIPCEESEDLPERRVIQGLITELIERHYHCSDIAILTYRNEDVVNTTTWLNEKGFPFVSYSSLDIRARKPTAEIVALLAFLDSPPDDLSFARFLLGDIFRNATQREGRRLELRRLHEFLFRNRKNAPLYKAFQQEFPKLWQLYFEELFRSTGYLPLYDLVIEIYRTYRVFDTFAQEEATFVKILEVIKDLEGQGRNNPSDFLRYALDEEAGEPPWTLDVPPGIDAIRVMTIHKAKGLGFPVVILLLYEETSRGFKYILDKERDGICVLKINKRISEANPCLKQKYEEERQKDWVNKLNTLYVGFTRAEEELYIVSVQGEKNQFPTDLLRTMDRSVGVKDFCRPRPSRIADEALALHHHGRRLWLSEAVPEDLNIEERERGDFIHRVLYLMKEGTERLESEIESTLWQVNEELRADYPLPEMKKTLLELLQQEDLRSLFQWKPARQIKKEQEFADAKGNLFRMDRVVIDEDRVSVIDFKTGRSKEAEKEYISQLRNYLRILEEIYPGKRVEGLIAYVDLKQIVRVT